MVGKHTVEPYVEDDESATISKSLLLSIVQLLHSKDSMKTVVRVIYLH